jgi:hypothetical protein
VQNAEHEAKDWANSEFLLLIGSNPLETWIPDARFVFDAAERGAQLVVVDPTSRPRRRRPTTGCCVPMMVVSRSWHGRLARARLPWPDLSMVSGPADAGQA